MFIAKKNIIFFLLLLSNCQNRIETLFDTISINDTIYCEVYNIYSGGVYGGDIYKEYLTDSLKFRVLIGETYDWETYKYQVINNTIIVNKFGDKNKMINQKIDSYKLYIDDLRITDKIKNN